MKAPKLEAIVEVTDRTLIDLKMAAVFGASFALAAHAPHGRQRKPEDWDLELDKARQLAEIAGAALVRARHASVMLKDPMWGWMRLGDEHSQGPFASRELAIEDAKAECSRGIEIAVGPMVRFDPAEFAANAIDVEGVDEHIVQAAEEWAWCPALELVDFREGAQHALELALTGWAREYLESDKLMLGGPTEIVTLP